MKTYKAKSSVKRAVVAELVKKNKYSKEEAVKEFNEHFTVEEKEGEFYGRRIQKPRNVKEVEACKDIDLEEGNSRREVEYTSNGDPIIPGKEEPAEEVEKNIVQVEINQSVAAKPCNLVWEIAIEMNQKAEEKGGPAPARKTVIEEAVRQGVAYNTARTQYQAWFKASKNS